MKTMKLSRFTMAGALLTSVLVASVATAAPLVSEVRNGGFESFGANGPADWTVESGLATASLIRSEGNLAVRLHTGFAAPVAFATIAQAVPQGTTNPPIVPGAVYEFSFDALGDYFQEGRGQASVTWKDALGNVVRVDTIPINPGAWFASYDAHLQAPLAGVPPAPATSATLRFTFSNFVGEPDAALFVDNVQFGLALPPLSV